MDGDFHHSNSLPGSPTDYQEEIKQLRSA
jgi:hypothetical protein